MATNGKPQIGFIGLGIMGSAMAGRLLHAGYDMEVYNRTVSRAEPLVANGAVLTAIPAQLAENADVIITMVSNDAALRQVTTGTDGILKSLHAGQTFINMSTVSPELTSELAKTTEAKQARFIDAPVSGSKPQAESGDLIILASGRSEDVERVTPIFTTLGKEIINAGETGMGTRLKLAVNLMLAHLAAALAEGFAFCDSAALDPRLLLEVVATSGALNAGYFQGKGQRMLNHDFSPQFPLKHMLKDVRLALQESNAPLAVTESIERLMSLAVTAGHGDEDVAAVAKAIGLGDSSIH